MKRITEEEKIQISTLQEQITESKDKLEPFKDKEEFIKLNELIKKETEHKKILNRQNSPSLNVTLMTGQKGKFSILHQEMEEVDQGNIETPHR